MKIEIEKLQAKRVSIRNKMFIKGLKPSDIPKLKKDINYLEK